MQPRHILSETPRKQKSESHLNMRDAWGCPFTRPWCWWYEGWVHTLNSETSRHCSAPKDSCCRLRRYVDVNTWCFVIISDEIDEELVGIYYQLQDSARIYGSVKVYLYKHLAPCWHDQGIGWKGARIAIVSTVPAKTKTFVHLSSQENIVSILSDHFKHVK